MLTLYTHDWLPEFPRGFVRDLRVRWLCEEIGRPYQVATVPVSPKSDDHRAMQPFAQVPMIRDGDLTLFESGAILLHLAQATPMMPEARQPQITQWVIAALSSVEPRTAASDRNRLAATAPQVFGPPASAELAAHIDKMMHGRLAVPDALLRDRDWLDGDFSVADLLMVDVIRPAAAEGALTNHPALAAFLDRATARPAFQRAITDHMAHWTAADAARASA